MHAWGRWLQQRQTIAILLLLVGLTTAMVGGVISSWPVIALGVAGMLGVLAPMALARRSGSPHRGP